MILSVRSLEGGYGELAAVRGVDLDVAVGHAVGILGPNGAGKTSLLRGLSGILPWCRGQVLLDGEDVSSLSPDRRVAAGLLHVPEGRGWFKGMTVDEHLRLCRLPKTSGRTVLPRERIYELFPSLAQRQRTRAGLLSGGELQMLAIARCLRFDPRVLLLDEPSSGLAPIVVQEVFSMIRTAAESGMGVVVVEQQARVALDVIDQVVVMAAGRIVMSRPRKEISIEDLEGAYLGSAGQQG